MSAVLCDAGPLIVLGKLNRLELLAGLYGQVQIPRAVYDEVVTQGLKRGAADAFAIRRFWQRQGWPIVDIPAAARSAYSPAVILGPGETNRMYDRTVAANDHRAMRQIEGLPEGPASGTEHPAVIRRCKARFAGL